MPKGFVMDHISRPIQIALIVVGLFAAVWLFALRGRSTSSPESSGSTPTTASATPSTASTPAAQAKAAGSPTPVYNGSAPGVKGLTSAIAKAHGAVETSQRNASELESKSAQASSAATPSAASPSTSATVVNTPSAVHVTAVHPATTAPKKLAAGAPAGQHAVEADLAQGKIVVLLFWNPAGVEDRSVQQQLKQIHGKVAVRYATPAQVSSFGTITRGVQVTGTPLLLIINKTGQTVTLAGLQDAYSIEQAISEARST